MRRVVLLLPLLLACQNPTGPTYGIPNAVPVPAPQPILVMDSLWADVQACSQITTSDPWQRIAWFTVAADSFPYDGLHTAIGLWTAPHHIYLATGIFTDRRYYPAYDTLLFRSVIRHEMLHDLTQSGIHGDAFRRCHLLPMD